MVAERVSIGVADDWHHHLRDGHALQMTVPMAARSFRRVIVMPNTNPPIRTVDEALAYKQRILAAVPEAYSATFEPLMTLYLTDATSSDEIVKAKANGIVACKLYPAGATTNSESGVTDLAKVDTAIREMAAQGLLLLLHGEVTDPNVDFFDREAVFLKTKLAPLIKTYSPLGLRIVLEHVTTREAVEFVASQPAHVHIGATITAHHLLYNRNALFQGGIRPHMFCLPVLKAEHHRQALLDAATSGNPRFFLGTDSAPHECASKESACGCAGVFTAHAALELYAEAFHTKAALAKLDAFASKHGAEFYGLPRNSGEQILQNRAWRPPKYYDFANGLLVPLRANQDVLWTLLPRVSSLR